MNVSREIEKERKVEVIRRLSHRDPLGFRAKAGHDR